MPRGKGLRKYRRRVTPKEKESIRLEWQWYTRVYGSPYGAIKHIAEKLGIPAKTVSRVVNGYEYKGYYSRTGEDAPTAKLKEAQVVEIWTRYYGKEKVTQEHLAKEYGVVQSTISCIVQSRSWRDVTKNLEK